MSKNIFWTPSKISKEERQKLHHHKSFILWFTGLSGSGKSTLAKALEEELHKRHIHSYVLDGDNIRHGLSKDLGFSEEDRTENIRRIGEVSKLFVDAGIICITAFISPFQKDRDIVRNIVEKSEFIEVFVKCPIEICEERDPKGLYKKARSGEITNFTGINSPYENPQSPEITVETNSSNIKDSIETIMDYLIKNQLII